MSGIVSNVCERENEVGINLKSDQEDNQDAE